MYDLSIRLKSSKEKDIKMTVKRLFELGWDCVAWTTVVNGKVSGTQIKPMKSVLLEPMQRRDAVQFRSLVSSSTASDIRQISRISVTIDDMIDAQSLTVGNAILNSFDIVSVRPGNIKVFAHLCKTADIDIITLDFTHRLPFPLNKKLLDEAVKRGIHFEIIYSPVIGPVAGARREVFSNTRVFIQYLRGRSLILSSGADSIGQLRGPMDVCNIGKLLPEKSLTPHFTHSLLTSLTHSLTHLLTHSLTNSFTHLLIDHYTTKQMTNFLNKDVNSYSTNYTNTEQTSVNLRNSPWTK
jgi:RNase P/RNase MRP subunit p30